MKLHVLFHHYDDDHTMMPNAIAVMDEFTIDTAGLDVWHEEMKKAKESMGPGSFREAIITVPDKAVLSLFGTHYIPGTVEYVAQTGGRPLVEVLAPYADDDTV